MAQFLLLYVTAFGPILLLIFFGCVFLDEPSRPSLARDIAAWLFILALVAYILWVVGLHQGWWYVDWEHMNIPFCN